MKLKHADFPNWERVNKAICTLSSALVLINLLRKNK